MEMPAAINRKRGRAGASVYAAFTIVGDESSRVLPAQFPAAGPGKILIAEIEGGDFSDRTLC